jgi:hypothetical protein
MALVWEWCRPDPTGDAPHTSGPCCFPLGPLPLDVDFLGGRLNSGGGLPWLAEADAEFGLPAALAAVHRPSRGWRTRSVPGSATDRVSCHRFWPTSFACCCMRSRPASSHASEVWWRALATRPTLHECPGRDMVSRRPVDGVPGSTERQFLGADHWPAGPTTSRSFEAFQVIVLAPNAPPGFSRGVHVLAHQRGQDP